MFLNNEYGLIVISIGYWLDARLNRRRGEEAKADEHPLQRELLSDHVQIRRR
jgi:hypothetical protein